MTYTCPYCGTELRNENQSYYCVFCEMAVSAEDVQQNGERRQITFQTDNVSISDAEQNTCQLMQRSTNDLIVLLRLVRQKRTDYYNYLRVINKASEKDSSFQNQAQVTGKDYEYWTRKAWVLENILRERTCVFPERITDDYLLSLSVRAEKINGKTMKISKGKRENQDTKV
ncbi:hypothetical protein IAQ67_29300 (plasmid) [Paenibacillus peoriae]|uniref:Uncharacterized protein n=1 Tax=Paenibacillus peoriae TaxID=59893 RepID=A0A7H0YHJ8_9BACL|nr:hypothetical protein [Paenibacillus peoriae]QNR70556.1 hypothetical protein IAQ67_29300 [Paenibacillus peoriae]